LSDEICCEFDESLIYTGKRNDGTVADEIVCIPSKLPGGLEAELSDSLEDSDVYNFVQISGDTANPENIKILSQRYSCHGVACVDPVVAISQRGASKLVVRAIGPDYLLRFAHEGIRIFVSDEPTVLGSTRAYAAGRLKELTLRDFPSARRK